MPALAGGGDFSHDDGWAMPPPKRKEALWRLREPPAPIVVRSLTLRGRKDFLLCPRFAHS